MQRFEVDTSTCHAVQKDAVASSLRHFFIHQEVTAGWGSRNFRGVATRAGRSRAVRALGAPPTTS